MGYIENIVCYREKRLRKLRKDFKREAFRLVQLIREKGVEFRRIYLFGSTVDRRRRFNFSSDIDLVIEGLNFHTYLKVYALLLRNSEFKVDLKLWEDLDERFKEKIKKRGMLVYEKR